MEITGISALLFYVTMFIISYLITQLIYRKFKKLPPSPYPTLPILGHFHLNLFKNRGNIHRDLSNLSNKFGSVFRFKLGSRRFLVVSSPQAAEDCLHKNDIVFANRPALAGTEITAYGHTTMAFSSYGPLWRAHRKIASTEMLSANRVNALSYIRADEVKQLLKRIHMAGSDKVITVTTVLYEEVTNVMMRMIAGKRIYYKNKNEHEDDNIDAIKFNHIIEALHSDNRASFVAVDYFPFLKYFGYKKKAQNKIRKIFTPIAEFFQGIVDEQRKKVEESEGSDECGKNDDRNVVKVLLDLQKKDPQYATDDIMKGLIQNLLLAGTETTASTMEWALALLLNHPEVLKSTKREIDEYVGKNRLLEEADLAHLPYLHCVIDETLRMYPGTPLLLPHQSSSNCVVDGYHIQKGTTLNVNVWGIQNDPKIWDEPEKFKPERFKGVKGDRIGYQYMPFGSGRRACPGENLAMQVLGLTLGSIIQCFDLERVGKIDMKEKVLLTMWKAKPLQVKFHCYSDMTDLLSHI